MGLRRYNGGTAMVAPIEDEGQPIPAFVPAAPQGPVVLQQAAPRPAPAVRQVQSNTTFAQDFAKIKQGLGRLMAPTPKPVVQAPTMQHVAAPAPVAAPVQPVQPAQPQTLVQQGLGGAAQASLTNREKAAGLNKGTANVPGPNVDEDVVPAMLTPGEAVLNKGAAEALGRDVIEALNKTHGEGRSGFRKGVLHANDGVKRVNPHPVGSAAYYTFENANNGANQTSIDYSPVTDTLDNAARSVDDGIMSTQTGQMIKMAGDDAMHAAKNGNYGAAVGNVLRGAVTTPFTVAGDVINGYAGLKNAVTDSGLYKGLTQGDTGPTAAPTAAPAPKPVQPVGTQAQARAVDNQIIADAKPTMMNEVGQRVPATMINAHAKMRIGPNGKRIYEQTSENERLGFRTPDNWSSAQVDGKTVYESRPGVGGRGSFTVMPSEQFMNTDPSTGRRFKTPQETFMEAIDNYNPETIRAEAKARGNFAIPESKNDFTRRMLANIESYERRQAFENGKSYRGETAEDFARRQLHDQALAGNANAATLLGKKLDIDERKAAHEAEAGLRKRQLDIIENQAKEAREAARIAAARTLKEKRIKDFYETFDEKSTGLKGDKLNELHQYLQKNYFGGKDDKGLAIPGFQDLEKDELLRYMPDALVKADRYFKRNAGSLDGKSLSELKEIGKRDVKFSDVRQLPGHLPDWDSNAGIGLKEVLKDSLYNISPWLPGAEASQLTLFGDPANPVRVRSRDLRGTPIVGYGGSLDRAALRDRDLAGK